ncbi:MAG TPA: NUDIX hydrolase [Vicinamibacterales bacterium]|nr:NUDIX hydrolase [Vicinamibacterales bacterium]
MEIQYNFCPTCAGPLALRLLKAGEPVRHVCTRCGQVIFMDPKVAVGTIIGTPGGKVVLVRRAIEPGYGLWVFPGGYVDKGEVVTDAAIREAREEAGLDIRLDRLLNVYSYPGRPLVVIVYAATAVGGQLCHDEESLEVGLFSEDEIPWDTLAFDSTHEGLRQYFRDLSSS